ncbi:uncharacterized protein isoform X2 [Musca autumnalis]|uniref:uncharacterized protein isoform X2 n=1 Tax=Musca autumnalis TaxID=221902 RepID=UPI003CE86286
MSSISDEQILITFEELTQLEIADISVCIDKYQALKICESSSAPAEDVYNLWIKKLLKAYDTLQFTNQDWVEIIGYLEKLLDNFVRNAVSSKSEVTSKHLNQWWTDTQEFIKWLQTIISDLDMHILCLILAFGFEIIIQTNKFARKGNMQPLTSIHQHLLHILTKNMFKIELQNSEDIQGLDKVLKSLCDVASIISSTDIKLSIETWRIVAKISGKCYETPMEIDVEFKDSLNELKRKSTEKPISGIIQELRKLFKYFQEDKSALNNDNFLKVAQFYLKLIKIVRKNASTLPSAAEYFEVYTTFVHQLKGNINSKLLDSIQSDLNDILANSNQRETIENLLSKHLLEDNSKFSCCDIVLEYLAICCDENRSYSSDAPFLNRIFNTLFDGPLVFVDSDKFSKILKYFTTLVAQDATGELHMQLCKHVIESNWIKAYTSCEILRIYYGYLFKLSDSNLKSCLEFWIKSWQRNKSYNNNDRRNYVKNLIEMILKTIISCLPQTNVEQFFENCTNKEIILLKCGVDNKKLLNYLNTKLTTYLKRIHNSMLLKREYTELLHLLDIWCHHEQFVMVGIVKDDLMKAFFHIFSLTSSEVTKFKVFLWKCFHIFTMLNDPQLDVAITKCLNENLIKTKTVLGAYLLEYLLHKKPQSLGLLKSLQTPDIIKLQQFLETPNTCETKNLTIFKDVNVHNPKTTDLPDVHISKRPRVTNGLCNVEDYKIILNEMLEHSQKLTTTATAFDNRDIELLNCIKHNIDKCLLK